MTEETDIEVNEDLADRLVYVVSRLKNKDWFAARKYFQEDMETISTDAIAMGMVVLYFTEKKANNGKSWEHYNEMTPGEVSEAFEAYSMEQLTTLFEGTQAQ